jgi:hypothetical protein
MLQSLVETACDALKAKDNFLREGQMQRVGILRQGCIDERYYQRLVAEQLFAGPCNVILEEPFAGGYYDLVLRRPDIADRFAVIEMKCWMDEHGSMNGIYNDVERLLAEPAAKHRIMLIFSANPSHVTQRSLRFLNRRFQRRFGITLTDGENFEMRSFHTYSPFTAVQNQIMDFWVGGIEVGQMNRGGVQ